MGCKRLALVVALAALVVTPVPRVHAWNDTGHMMAALLAYRQLSPADQAKAVAILKAAFDLDDLPRFRQDLTAAMPQDLSPADQDRFLFVKAATWPDIIRDGFHPCHDKFHKGPWHFINLPFVAEGDPTPMSPAPVPTPEGEEPKDILSAIQLCRKEIKAPGTAPHVRAARLCFLLHMIGDLHQPLHAAAQFSNDGLKRGDLGGNTQLLRRPGSGANHDVVMSIHEIFDGLLGREERVARLSDRVAILERDPQLQPTSLTAFLPRKDPLDWAKESLEDAIEVAYLKGALKSFRGMTVRQFHKENLDVTKVPLEPPGYEANARLVAERRIVLAGHRLAAVLHEVLP